MKGSLAGRRPEAASPRWGAASVGPDSIPVIESDACGVEPMTGIEPAYLAWEASALPLSYIGVVGPL